MLLREAWHPKQRVEKLDDGTLMLTVPLFRLHRNRGRNSPLGLQGRSCRPAGAA